MIGTLDQRYREVTIVGAGIAGMLAAYALDRRGYRVTLLEQNQRAGGLIQTTKTDCGIAESAAHSIIATEAVRELCRDLGVELIEPHKEARAKYVVREGRLRRFPLTLGEAVSAFGRAAFARSSSDATAYAPIDATPDLESWALRHLGKAALDYLLTPFVRGIYGVQPAELGVSPAFPFLKLPAGKTLLGAALAGHRSKSSKKQTKTSGCAAIWHGRSGRAFRAAARTATRFPVSERREDRTSAKRAECDHRHAGACCRQSR